MAPSYQPKCLKMSNNSHIAKFPIWKGNFIFFFATFVLCCFFVLFFFATFVLCVFSFVCVCVCVCVCGGGGGVLNLASHVIRFQL